jgi:2-dehydro-3-deoxygalactonokinase
LNPDWDGVICLPGTHTKWVQMSAGEIVSFQTFMTGEIFALLSTASVLRYSVQSDDWDQTAFDHAVDEAMSRPEAIAARLFGLRAASLLNDLPEATAKSRLSGLLIGAELAAAKPYWLGQSLTIIGAKSMGDGYAAALAAQHVPVIRTDTTRMTLAGLKVAYTNWKEIL